MSRPPFLLATRSDDKLREIRQLLPQGLSLLTLHDIGLHPEPDEESVESYLTFRENALAKARYFAERTRMPSLADDSGLSVDALEGAPGVYSKRFAASPGLVGAALDEANNRLLLERLAAIPEGRRAHYTCAAAVAWPDGSAAATLGTVHGSILRQPRGNLGFGYDPLFQPAGEDRSFAELSAEAKNSLSHRGRAFRALAVLLALRT